MVPSKRKLQVAFIVMLSNVYFGCACIKKNEFFEYVVLLNNPNIRHVEQPWPLSDRADKVFYMSSASIEKLFTAQLKDSKFEENRLSWEIGKALRNRDEIYIQVVSRVRRASILIEKGDRAWRNGVAVEIDKLTTRKAWDAILVEAEKYSERL